MPLDRLPDDHVALKLGTKGGLRTDDRVPVLRPDGTPIAGLYAAGNASAWLGRSYARRGRHHRAGHDLRLPRRARHGQGHRMNIPART